MIKDLNKVKKIDNVEDFELEHEVSEVTQGGGLVMLPVDKLYPHPDNPRKKLGDLSELADSIKAKGIMQNLTVVPRVDHPGTYTIIIGHRRHAAAKKAGLSEVPCVIVEMSEQEQIATMLLENIQRSDLTAYEQAKGFQMMMDFGDSVSTIVEKTGFSESTVRRRLKMAELDDETLEKVSGRQLSLGDFDKLSEIEDIDVRNKVLADIGTANFNNSLKSAVDKQKLAATVKEMKEAFCAAGLYEITSADYSKHSYQGTATGTKDIEKSIEVAKSRGAVGYYYSYRDTFYFMSKKEAVDGQKTEAQLEREKAERERKERCNLLKSTFERLYQLRREFIDNYTLKQATINLNKISAYMLVCGINGDLWDEIPKEELEKLLFGRETTVSSYEEMCEEVEPSAAAKSILVAVWLLTDSDDLDCHDYYGRYDGDEKLEMIYEFLEFIGYEMSDEERELLDGTSELYLKEE